MLKRIMQLFSMTEADAQRVDAMEVLSRAKAARQKANRAFNIADQQVTKAEQALYTAQLENQNSYRDYLFARQTIPKLRKSAAALEYVAQLRLAAGRWDVAERVCTKSRERLDAARNARREAKARQNSAAVLIRQAETSLRKKSKK